MERNLYTPLIRKAHVDERLSQLETIIGAGKVKYFQGLTADDVKQRIRELREAEMKFFEVFDIKANTTKEAAAELNEKIEANNITLTDMNGSNIQKLILDKCSQSYNDNMLKYLRKHIITDEVLKSKMLETGETDWRKAFIGMLNEEIEKTTGKKGRLKTATKGLSDAKLNSFADLLASNLTARAKEVIQQRVDRETKSKRETRPLYDFVLEENKDELTIHSDPDWRTIIKGMTPTQAEKWEYDEEHPLPVDDINDAIIDLIVNYAKAPNPELLRDIIIKDVLAENRYAFFVGNNNKAITGLLGEIQGLYYIRSLWTKEEPPNLKWLADTLGTTSKKLSIDILLDEIGVQVKNTARDLEDPYASHVSFTKGMTVAKLVAALGGKGDEQLVEAISSLYQTYSFNVEYQYGDQEYVEGENLDFRDTRLTMEHLLSLTEDIFALWMSAAMHLGVNKSAKDAIKDNKVSMYFVNGVFYGASDILANLLGEIEDRAERGFSFSTIGLDNKDNIVGYLNSAQHRQSMYSTKGKNLSSIDLKLSGGFHFGSLG